MCSQTRVCALVAGAEGSALSSLGPTAVFSVHLDATHEDQRVAQLAKCLQQARQLGTREVIVAGDMNTEILRVLSAPTAAQLNCCARLCLCTGLCREEDGTVLKLGCLRRGRQSRT